MLKIYEDSDSLIEKKLKCKDIILKYPDEMFDIAKAALTAHTSSNNSIVATCSDGCCAFDWESIDEFLEDYILKQYQDIEE